MKREEHHVLETASGLVPEAWGESWSANGAIEALEPLLIAARRKRLKSGAVPPHDGRHRPPSGDDEGSRCPSALGRFG